MLMKNDLKGEYKKKNWRSPEILTPTTCWGMKTPWWPQVDVGKGIGCTDSNSDDDLFAVKADAVYAQESFAKES